MSGPQVSVVVVSFHSEATLGEAVASVPPHAEVVVVEQGASGTAGRVAREARADAVVVNSGANRGFGAGCNVGAANASGGVLLFLNPDAVLLPGALDALASALEDPTVGTVGPTLLDEDGEVATEARNFSRPLHDAFDLAVPHGLIPRRMKRDIPMSDRRYAEGGAVPYVQGACFAVRRDDFFCVGGFDESFFLYGEEEYLAYAFARRGLTTVLVPSAVVRHVGQTSTDAVGLFATEQLFRSLLLTYRRTRGPAAAYAGFVMLSLGMLALLAGTPVRRLIGFRSTETSASYRAGLRGLRSGLWELPVRPPGGGERGLWSDVNAST